MGSGGYCGLQSTRHSDWPVGTEIYVRRKVMIPAGATNIRIMAAADNDILAFFDGIALGPTITHEDCPILDEFRLNVEPYAGTVTAGEHTLAFYIKDRGNQSFFDMRLLVDVNVTVQKLQYRLNGAGAFADVAGALTVAEGTTVEFKALPSPSGAAWPANKPLWGGTSGASGTGASKSVTFNTVSTSATDYKTVTAQSGNTVTANVVVAKVQKLQYRLAQNGVGQGAFVDVPSTLYVPLNQQVEFQAIANPTGLAWPTDANNKPDWSSTGAGVAGAINKADNRIVTFSELGDKSVTALYGNSITANIKVAEIELNFTGLPRACAGGVDNDAHIFTLQFNAKRNGQNLANTDLAFSFSNNQSYSLNKKAKFRTPANLWAETTTITTDANGNSSITVISSDIISSNNQITAKQNNQSITKFKLNNTDTQGGVTCDFASPTYLRRFGLKDYVEDVDSGWIFNPNLLTNPDLGTQLGEMGNTIPAKVYLKFRRDPNNVTHPIDQKYFLITKDENADGVPDDNDNNGIPDLIPSETLDANGDGIITPDERDAGSVRRPLSDDGNWAFVIGHLLRVKIIGVVRHDQANVSSADFSQYATLVVTNGVGTDEPASFIDILTAIQDGGASVKIRSNSLINDAEEIILEAEDQTAISP